MSPTQSFHVGPYRYIKDRAYSFEMKLNANTEGILNKRLKDYVKDESNAVIPLMIYHSLVNRDAKKILISTQPVRFMAEPPEDSTQNPVEPDAIDFVSFFSKQDPYNLRMLTALRMNATFPVVLPSVWLPTQPVIDVMDGGLRDNYGIENSLRFLNFINDWIKENTRGVLVLQIRDRQAGGWEDPYELEGFADHTIKPIMLLQHNWSKMMEYFQNDMYTYYASSSGYPIHKIILQYSSGKSENRAALNFHLSKREKNDIAASVYSKDNTAGFKKTLQLLNEKISTDK